MHLHTNTQHILVYTNKMYAHFSVGSITIIVVKQSSLGKGLLEDSNVGDVELKRTGNGAPLRDTLDSNILATLETFDDTAVKQRLGYEEAFDLGAESHFSGLFSCSHIGSIQFNSHTPA